MTEPAYNFVNSFRLDKIDSMIIYEDDHLIAINKPPNMFSVPGREHLESRNGRMKRTEEWTNAVQEAAKTKNTHDPLGVLQSLATLLLDKKNVPRKRQKFIGYMNRMLKTKNNDAGKLFEVVKAIDRRMHTLNFESIPSNLISAADVAERITGDQVFIVHRLDIETSGIILFAKSEESAGEICRQFRDREVGCAVYVRSLSS